MKKIPKILFCCVLLLLSCQVEQIDKKNLSSKKPDHTEENSGEVECETFFAKGDETKATCFLENGFNRWGWTNGPLTTGEYTFDLYAGAGRCDIEKGTLVGILTIDYDEVSGTAEIDFEMLEGFILSETHLYISNEPYPTDENGNSTVAPGQFPYQHQLDGVEFDSYTVNGLFGQIYIIAHGTVCNDDDGDDGDDGNGGPY